MLGNNLVFIDSFQFISSSLNALVSNLPKEALKYTSQKCSEVASLVRCLRKASIRMSIWIRLKNSIKQNYPKNDEFYRKIHYLTREFRVKLHAKTDIARIAKR